MKKNIPLLLSVSVLMGIAACHETADESGARHLSTYYAQKGDQMTPAVKKVDQRNPPPNATPTPPTQAAPLPGRL